MKFYKIEDKKVTLNIKAQPAASKNEFSGIYGEDALKIRVKAAAVEGAANKELVKFLSKSFKVAKSDFSFKSGETSKIKRLCFPVTDTFLKIMKEFEDGKSI